MDTIRKLCSCVFCCPVEDDEAPLIANSNQSTGPIRRHSSLNEPVPNQRTPSNLQINGRTSNPARSAQDEEDAMLRRILENTQQNIIDVSNMDGSPMTGGDYIERQGRYDESIKHHDLKVRKRSSTASHDYTRNNVYLLEDAGNRVADLLSRPQMPQRTIIDARLCAVSVNRAVMEGIRVTHREDLVVFMSLPD